MPSRPQNGSSGHQILPGQAVMRTRSRSTMAGRARELEQVAAKARRAGAGDAPWRTAWLCRHAAAEWPGRRRCRAAHEDGVALVLAVIGIYSMA